MTDIGVELGATTLRAVRVTRRGRAAGAVVEVAWDPERPDEGVAALASRLGGARRVGLAVGLAFLRVARVSLPALGAADRRRALALEPDRYFAGGEELVVALAPSATPPNGEGGGEPAFAAERAPLERWVSAFSRWAPVEGVAAAPAALAHALGRPGSAPDATYTLPAAAGEVGTATFAGGRLVTVRRARAVRPPPDAADVGPRPPNGARSPEALVAYGAALGADAPVDAMLLPPSLAARVAARRRRRLAAAVGACLTAAWLCAAAAGRARAGYLDRVDAALVAAERAAAPAVRLQARAAALARAERDAEALLARRADPLAVLAALTERLPPDASALAVQASGDEWQVDGAARDAAAVVPLLDGDPRLADVRALAPSSRYESGGRVRETFSIAFRAGRAGDRP